MYPTLGQIRTEVFSLTVDGIFDKDSVDSWAQNVHLKYVTSAKGDDTPTQEKYYDQYEINHNENKLEQTMFSYHVSIRLQSQIKFHVVRHHPFANIPCKDVSFFESKSGCTDATIRSPSSTHKS